MGAGRVLVGTLFCAVAAYLIVFFVTLNYDYSALGDPVSALAVFFWLVHPLAAINGAMWSALAALAVGALIGGLVSKSPGGGLAVGILSFIVMFIMFIGLTVGFDIGAWITWIETYSGIIALDLLLSVAILAVVGAIGGKLTAESD